MIYILGISAFYHDSAAALLADGDIVAAAQEERFTRKKHDATFPVNSINYVLYEAGIDLHHVDFVVFYDKPFLKFERILETFIATAPYGFKQFSMAMPIWLKEKLFLKKVLTESLSEIGSGFDDAKLLFSEHHLSHAASAFYPSPFDEAIVLTIDGVGEWTTTSVSIGKGESLEVIKEINFPHSLGLLYSAFTYYIGFRINSGEYKMMGLAPYGSPIYKNLIIDELIDLKDDGSYRLNMSYFKYMTGLTMVGSKFESLFGEPARKPDTDPITQFHMDIAASIQSVIEEIILRMVRFIASEYSIDNLCMAGGVALNCVANGKILRDGAVKRLWVQPAAGDAGGALGAAYATWHKELANPRRIDSTDSMKGAYLGPEFTQDQIEEQLTRSGAVFETVNDDEMLTIVSRALKDGNAVGWFQGRMEFGPRALGGRSILGDPQSDQMQKLLNLKVKFRESFRPFAPSVLREDVSNWFEFDGDSPYMLFVDKVHPDKCIEMKEEEKELFGIDKLNISRSAIPAVTHVDYSARIQTVTKDLNDRYYKLIKKFKEKTGCPVLINTSFNVRGEPIVGTPEDAFRCFMGTGIDMLAIGNCVLTKKDQNEKLVEDYKDKYELD